jgi:hypothetical protein
MMTKEEFAAMITGREYGQELTPAEEAQAKAAGLLVVYGASDDLMEFSGAFRDEQGAWGGTTARVTPSGLLPSWDSVCDDEDDAEQYFKRKPGAKEITATWDSEGYSWVIGTALPHAPFEIMEDGEKYCRGLVLAMADLTQG